MVLVVMDTTRGDRCSVNGYRAPTTPAIQALGAEGAVFRNAWSPSPWTGPSHASLFTGLRPEHHRFLSGRMHEYLREMPTLAGWLRDAGYETACFSNNTIVSREFGLDQGFAYELRDFENLDRPYPWARSTHEAALAWARRCREQGESFFLFVNDMEPHFPYTPPEPFERQFVNHAFSAERVAWARAVPQHVLVGHMTGAFLLPRESLELLSELYDGEVACLDGEVGRLVEGFRQMGILDNTIFVIVSDHGENFGDHGCVNHLASLYRSVLQVPLVIRYPARFAAGTVIDHLVRLEDIAPTILKMCALAVPPGLDGESLLGPVGGRVARASYLPFTGGMEQLKRDFPWPIDMTKLDREILSANDGRWHYVLYSDGQRELYDLEADPTEELNLAATRPEEVRRLEALLPVLPATSLPVTPAVPPR